MFPAARVFHLGQIDDRDGNGVRHGEKDFTNEIDFMVGLKGRLFRLRKAKSQSFESFVCGLLPSSFLRSNPNNSRHSLNVAQQHARDIFVPSAVSFTLHLMPRNGRARQRRMKQRSEVLKVPKDTGNYVQCEATYPSDLIYTDPMRMELDARRYVWPSKALNDMTT